MGVISYSLDAYFLAPEMVSDMNDVCAEDNGAPDIESCPKQTYTRSKHLSLYI